MDNEGNKIELWEPVDSVFTPMGGGNYEMRHQIILTDKKLYNDQRASDERTRKEGF